MKKIILTCFLIIILLFIYELIPINKENNTNKIKVAEVTHSVFYTPQYVALSKGYFKDEGLDIELILTPGADKVTAAVLSGDVDIGLCGPEATIYIYNNNVDDYLITFAQLTKKDGSFLVSREKYDNFNINDLKGKNIIGGRAGGMPEMTFEWALKQNGIDLNEVNIDTSIQFSAMEGAFISGNGDFVTLFEPNASNVVKNGHGYIVASIGILGGDAPFTTYNAKKSYIENNKDIINGFRNAINKGLEYVRNNSSYDIALLIQEFFTGSTIEELEVSIENYKNQDTWNYDTNMTINSWNHLQDIMESSNVLEERVSFDKLVINE